MDAKWWQKLTLPLAWRAKNVSKFDEFFFFNNFPFLDLFMSKTVIIIWQKNSPLVHVSLCDTGLY